MSSDSKNSSEENSTLHSVDGASEKVAPSSSSDIDELRSQVEKAQNDYLYLRAEFDNYRKNAIKERSDLVKFGIERLARELLEVVDTFELALQAEVNPENLQSFVKGLELTSANLKTTLGRFGVTELNPLGEDFDPSVHEALSSEPSDSVEPGKISRVFKKAYKLHDRLLRPAQVIVAVKPDNSESEKTSGDQD